jgi:F-type H+-transporting ATPase subunit delta
MSELTVASRYAKSIIDLAEEKGLLNDVNNDMVFFLHTLKANSELKAVLANPIISHQKKLGIVDAVFAAKINKVSTSFFKLMINKGRGELLYPTAQAYIDLYDAKKNITKVSVVSATALSAANKGAMIAEIKAAVGGEIDLDTKVDPSLIGGFVLTIGDRQLDTSIANSLKKLKKDFAGGLV